MQNKLKFIDFFAGVGGMRRGLELAGCECIGFCEYDKFPVMSYTAMHLATPEQLKHIKSLPMKQRQKEILKEEYRNGEWYAGDIRSIKGGDIPKADIWGYGSPCFTKGTLITTHRGLIPIEEIKAGDLVLTHKNRFKRVITPMINIKRGIYTLKVQGSPNTEVTGNHRFYVREKQKKWNNEKRMYEYHISEPFWREVKDFTGNELIQFPNNLKNENIYNLTEEECWLIGRYIADGYIRDDIRKDRPSHNQKVVFCIGKQKAQDFEKHISNIKMLKINERTAIKYSAGNKKLFALCLQCGRGAENKIIPQYILNLPSDLLKIFIDGYMSGDGSYSKNVYKATSISKKLIYQLGQCIEKAYKKGYSIFFHENEKTTTIEGRIVNQKDSWIINYRAEPQKSLSYYIDDCLWCPIKEITYNPKRVETVYNMEVEDDNSYTANNMGAHNCQDFSIAGKRAGLEGDKSSLIREIFRLLNEISEEDRPEWLIYENVKGMLSSNKGWDYASILIEMDSLGYDVQWQLFNSCEWGVPQNRERVYTVGHLRSRGSRKIFPVGGTNQKNSISVIGNVFHNGKTHQGDEILDVKGAGNCLKATIYKSPVKVGIPIKVEQIGRTPRDNRDNPNDGRVYSPDGIASCLNSMGGGNREPQVPVPVFVDMSTAGAVFTDTARCLKARYNAGVTNRQGDNSGIAVPVLTPDRAEKRQNGRRFKENGEPMFTLTAQDKHGVAVNVEVGGIYTNASPEFQRGICKDKARTLKSSNNDAGVVYSISAEAKDVPEQYIKLKTKNGAEICAVWSQKYECYMAIRKLTPRECFRLQGWNDEYFDRAALVNSDSQLYKQAGNGITVNVAEAVGRAINQSKSL